MQFQHPLSESDSLQKSMALAGDAPVLNGKLYFEPYEQSNNCNWAVKKNRTLTAKDIVNAATNLRAEIRSHGKKHGGSRPGGANLAGRPKVEKKRNRRLGLALT